MEEDYSGKEEMTYPLAYLAKTDEDVMYYHQAMQQLKKFVRAIVKEMNDQCNRTHRKLILKEDVPEGKPLLESIWLMK